jgi:hypothetical protein
VPGRHQPPIHQSQFDAEPLSLANAQVLLDFHRKRYWIRYARELPHAIRLALLEDNSSEDESWLT